MRHAVAHRRRPSLENAPLAPDHELQSVAPGFGFIASSGEQRVRELAVNKPDLIDRYPELRDRVDKTRGSEIGLDPRYEYFRYLTRSEQCAGGSMPARQQSRSLRYDLSACRPFDFVHSGACQCLKA